MPAVATGNDDAARVIMLRVHLMPTPAVDSGMAKPSVIQRTSGLATVPLEKLTFLESETLGPPKFQWGVVAGSK
jgi:hypothetical protein